MLLFAIDFDYTLTKYHTHNLIIDAILRKTISRDDSAQQWDLVASLEKSDERTQQWKNLLEQMDNDGHKIAILSFNQFSGIIPLYLREIIGISKALIDKIFIYSIFPEEPKVATKNPYLEHAKQHFKFERENQDIVLIDDSQGNIDAALEENYKTILAEREGSHFQKIQNILNYFNRNAEISEKHSEKVMTKKPKTEKLFLAFTYKPADSIGSSQDKTPAESSASASRSACKLKR